MKNKIKSEKLEELLENSFKLSKNGGNNKKKLQENYMLFNFALKQLGLKYVVYNCFTIPELSKHYINEVYNVGLEDEKGKTLIERVYQDIQLRGIRK